MSKSSTLYLRLKRKILSQVSLVRWVLGISTVLAIIAVGLWIRQPAQVVSETLKQSPLPQRLGRTNFLILGIGGGNHDGFDLTDTMIFASVNIDTGDTFLLSIPRDIWVPFMRAKINTAYHYGQKKDSNGGGLVLAKSAVSSVIDQPIDFATVIDFSTFTKFIDMIGGIDVDVERTFDDLLYPTSGKENDTCGLAHSQASVIANTITDDASAAVAFPCRYEHLRFEQGEQHMDGATALKYVRSRHSTDPEEGSDFARSRRQGRVISAIQKRLVSLDVLSHPKIYQELMDLASQSVKTDIASEYYYGLTKLSLKMKSQTFRSKDLIEPDHLVHPMVSAEFDNQWVLLPKANLVDFVASQLKP